MTLAQAKRALRKASLAARSDAHARASSDAGERAARHFRAHVPLMPEAVVSGYWPFRDEFDPRPLMRACGAAGHVVALPVVTGRGQTLLFRVWRPDMRLETSGYGIAEPPADAEAVVPDLLVVPLLAFDGQGYRLGYGGGYYDRTLAALRETGRSILAVGLAFAAQEVDEVPHGPGDQRLDWVVTEERARRLG